MLILVIDVGGTEVKILATGQESHRQFASSSSLTAKQMVAGVLKTAAGWKYEAISIGYPGPVRPAAQTVQRYLLDKTVSARMVWRFNHKIRSMPAGKSLRVETLAPAIIHYSVDDWKTSKDVKSRDVGLGIHIADLATQSLPDGKEIEFTFYWPGAGRWEGTDFIIRIGSL